MGVGVFVGVVLGLTVGVVVGGIAVVVFVGSKVGKVVGALADPSVGVFTLSVTTIGVDWQAVNGMMNNNKSMGVFFMTTLSICFIHNFRKKASLVGRLLKQFDHVVTIPQDVPVESMGEWFISYQNTNFGQRFIFPLKTILNPSIEGFRIFKIQSRRRSGNLPQHFQDHVNSSSDR